MSIVQSDSKLLSGFSWSINRKPDNNLESFCMFQSQGYSRERDTGKQDFRKKDFLQQPAISLYPLSVYD
jgi:hypothetical protein